MGRQNYKNIFRADLARWRAFRLGVYCVNIGYKKCRLRAVYTIINCSNKIKKIFCNFARRYRIVSGIHEKQCRN